MANMGSTGTVNVAKSYMDAAVRAIEEYQETVNAINGKVKSEVESLIPANFSGSAADGFKVFYETKVAPVTGDTIKQMLDGLKEICNAVKKQIPESEGVDEQLGQVNKQPNGSN